MKKPPFISPYKPRCALSKRFITTFLKTQNAINSVSALETPLITCELKTPLLV